MVTQGDNRVFGWRPLRRALRLAGRAVLVVSALVCLALLTLLLPAMRGALLGVGLGEVNKVLPGDLQVGDASWPAFGHLVLEDLVWLADDSDTLATVPRLELAISLSSLRQHDLVVESLVVQVATADVPGIEAAMIPTAAEAAAATAPDTAVIREIPWLRAGAVSGVPSVVLQDLDCRVGRLVAAPGLVLHDMLLQGQVDAGHGRTSARVDLTTRMALEQSGATPVFLELDRLELGARYGPGTGQVELDTLVAVMVGGPVSRRTSLRAAGPLNLRLSGDGEIDPVSTGHPIRLAVEGWLNGPLAGLWGDSWPDSLSAAEYANCEAGFTVEAQGSLEGTIDAVVALDLDGCDGLERGRLHFRTQIEPDQPADLRARIDTLDLKVQGCSLVGRGALTDSTVNLVLAADAAAPIPLLVLAGPAWAAADLAFELDIEASGPRRSPEGRLDFTGRYRDRNRVVEDVSLNLVGGLAGLTARLRSGRLVQDGTTVADTVACDLDYAPDQDLPLTLSAFAGRGTDRIATLVTAGADSVATVRLDSLQVVIAGQPIRLKAPATVRLDTVARVYTLDELVLTGAPGHVRMAASLQDRELNLSANVDLLFTQVLLEELAPSEIWSRDGGVDLAVKGDVELGSGAGATVFGGELGAELQPHRDRPRVGAYLSLRLAEGDRSGLAADLRITANDSVLLHGSAFAPGKLDLEGGGWLPDTSRDLELVVPEQSLPLAHFDSFLPEELAARGEFLLAADVSWPLAWTGAPGDTIARGKLAARLEARELQIDLPNRSRLELDLACGLEGTPLNPELVGEVTVESGFIRIPELPRSLHPTEGKSLLWEAVRVDSTGQHEAVTREMSLMWRANEDIATPAAPLPEMDLRIILPGNLRLNGYGLDAELTGEIQVQRGVDKKGRPGPSLRGQVGMVRGTFLFMNRNFDIERGNVVFTGQVPPNPELDLFMRTQTGGYRINVGVRGRADEPVVDLTSEPDLNKADVMAVLLFGRPLNGLDNDQRGRMSEENDASQQLQDSLASLALVFGTKGIQDSMTNTFGVDMVEIGTDSSGGSTFAAGKYLNPSMLLKYNQSLENSGTYYMTLEYILNQAFRVVSTYGQGEESSGLELKWERRY